MVGWSEADGELAQVVWEQLSEPAKELFTVLMNEPGVRFSGDALSSRLGLPNGKHGVAGVLGWPMRHCRSVGRAWPWAWEYPEGKSAQYWMTEEVADLFRHARDGQGQLDVIKNNPWSE